METWVQRKGRKYQYR